MCVSGPQVPLKSTEGSSLDNVCLSFMPYPPRPFLDQQLQDDGTLVSISVTSLPQALVPGSWVTSVSVSDLNSVVPSQE